MEEYAGGLCEHHPEHDDECGYSEGIAGTDCSHEHTDDCYTEVVKCTHRHDEDCYPDEIIWDDEATPSDADRWEPEDCPHMCEEDSECITKKLNCRHEHDDECGYSPRYQGNTMRICMGWKRKINQPEYKWSEVCMKRVKILVCGFSLAIALVALPFPYIDDITSASASALLQCFCLAWYSGKERSKKWLQT